MEEKLMTRQEILTKLASLKRDIDDLERALRADMKIEHLEISSKHDNHEGRLKLTEKILFTSVGAISLAVLMALIGTVLI